MLEHSIAPATGVGYSIANSLRLNDDDSAYLSRTPSSAGNRKTWTWSGWIKRGNLSATQDLFSCASGSSDATHTRLRIGSDNKLAFFGWDGGYAFTNAVLRDVGAWYHILCVCDTTQATASDRAKLYINGELQTVGSSGTITLNEDLAINSTAEHVIGQSNYGNNDYFDGYLAEVNFVDGQALTPADFGETGDYGEWKPIEYTGTYGTNGFYLDFENSGSLGADVSGNGNNWTPNNLAATDQMLDTPTNNFCTWNPLDRGADATLSEGNQKIYYGSSGTRYATTGTMGVSSGKWYYEIVNTQSSQTNCRTIFGFANTSSWKENGYYCGQTSTGWGYYGYLGTKYHAGSSSYGDTWQINQVIGVALDADAGTITFYNENISQGIAWSDLPVGDTFYPCIGDGGTSDTLTTIANFGQDSSFAGNKTAQGNADGNGYGDFYYTPPSGFLALCTQNLPDPTVVPSEHFNTVLYTGNGVDNHAITGVGFQPDFLWIKQRGTLDYHWVNDAVRGATNNLYTNVTNAEVGINGGIKAFNTDGFTVGIEGGVNDNAGSFVAWNWKANGSGVSNTNGSITSTVSANQDAGFSIVSYTGTGSATQTIGHGLSKAPEMVIVKRRDASQHWIVYHAGNTPAPETEALLLSATDATYDHDGYWDDTAPTNLVFTVDTFTDVNASGGTYIAYCFHSVDGYSKVGSYTGNGSTDGTFVYTGFRPAYVMVKRYDGGAWGWNIYDNERDDDNVVGTYMAANSTDADNFNSVYYKDFLSNGFKLRTTHDVENGSGSNYIYIAFAESPFKHTNAR